LLVHLVEKVADSDKRAWALFIVREQMHPTEAFERLYAGVMGRILEKLATLVAIVTNSNVLTAKIVAITLYGQALVPGASRASLLRLLGAETFDQPLIDAIKARVATNTEAILNRLTAEQAAVR
jgi:hypothetical protein